MRINYWYLLLAAIVAGLVYLFSQLIEFYEKPVEEEWSREARRNPFLAAEHFLAALAMPVESSDRLDVLDSLSQDSALVIGDANQVLSAKRADELVRWMEAGGHVIVAAQAYDPDNPDVLLSRFDVSKHEADDGFFDWDEDDAEEDQSDEEALQQLLEQANQQMQEQREQQRIQEQAASERWDAARNVREQEARAIADNLVYLSFEGVDHQARADYSGSGSLSHPLFYLEEGEVYDGYQPFYWAGNENAIGFMQLEVGAGLLTVMADVNIWTSSQIGLFDHAFLLEMLTESADKVIFLYGAVVPNVMELLWQHFQELSVSLLLIIALWVVYRARRFGPVAVVDTATRRSFEEHIRAVSNFLWRNRMGEHLIDAARQDVWRRFYQRYPGSERLDEAKRLGKLAEASKMELQQLRILMSGSVPVDEIHFYHSIKKLQNIRKAL